MLSIEEILNSHEFIYFDTSSLFKVCTDFYQEIYRSNIFSDINRSFLEENQDHFIRGVSILEKDNTFTVKEVTQEINSISRILGEKLLYLRDKNKLWQYNKKFRNNNHNKEIELLLQKLQDDSNSLYKISCRKAVRYNNENYSKLLDLICSLSDLFNLKIDSSYIHRSYRLPEENKNKNDEIIATNVLYECFFNKRIGTLVAHDIDFLMLLRETTKILCSESSINKGKIISTLSENPPILYLCNRENRNFYDKIIFSDFTIPFKTKDYIEKIKGLSCKIEDFSRCCK